MEKNESRLLDKKKIILFVLIFLVLLLLVGGTYAYWTFTSNSKRFLGSTLDELKKYIIYDEGESHFVGNFQPMETFCESTSTTLSFSKNKDAVSLGVGINASINMDINSIGSNISSSNDVYWILTSGDNNITCSDGLSNSNIVNYGTFNGKTAGKTIVLAENIDVTFDTKKYTVWLWIDGSSSDLSLLSGETIDTNVSVLFSQYKTESVVTVNAPVLDENGMIPVVISDTGVVKTISKTDSNWYNYKNREWANVILTTSGSRSKYLGTSGITVTQSDILAYYVWIPRYKYKIWTTGTSSSGKEQPVEVIFEAKEDEMTNGSAVGEYRTHPAFWWDSDNNGVVDSNETLAGIWVGKFETTGDATTPTILPDVQSLRSQNVSTQFITSLKFSGGTLTNGTVTFAGSDTYGLSSTTNSHMMKNSEWGAVAYLSHSIYGANREIYINNSSSYYTGRSGGNVGGSTAINTVYTNQTSTTQYNSYGFYTWDGYLLDYNSNTKGTTHDITKVASTTGNITGIYDMSGGAWEYVMGVLADSNGNPRSGYNANNTSGFNGKLASETYTSGKTFPTKQYYDLYTSTSSTTACNGGRCYGHALFETSSWYSDGASFVSSNYPWFNRGSGYNDGTSAGSFYAKYSAYGGSALSSNSWRSALLVSGAV